MKKIIIVGASGHSKVIIDIFEKNKDYQIIALIDSNKAIGSQIFKYTVEGNHNHIPILLKNIQIVKYLSQLAIIGKENK